VGRWRLRGTASSHDRGQRQSLLCGSTCEPSIATFGFPTASRSSDPLP
jgi:hypothetical protein